MFFVPYIAIKLCNNNNNNNIY